ncbi:hypothetical protein Taro_042869 [Colocasia esculenta]|uniref:Large ribosomal subunit protein bL25 beta domain-containing protein n=1 Tax=Colocasia esculenta TaxID=4460 RepID=A0A843WHZ5_COLES|nr:hypothetical protein [Colocasia esculenta]
MGLPRAHGRKPCEAASTPSRAGEGLGDPTQANTRSKEMALWGCARAGVRRRWEVAAVAFARTYYTIQAVPREYTGSRVAARERALGRIPAVVIAQGGGDGPEAARKLLVTADSKQIVTLLKRVPFFCSTTFVLQVRAGAGSSALLQSGTVLPVKVHKDAETGKILNLVLAWADKGTELKVDVPVVYKGEDVCPGLQKEVDMSPGPNQCGLLRTDVDSVLPLYWTSRVVMPSMHGHYTGHTVPPRLVTHVVIPSTSLTKRTMLPYKSAPVGTLAFGSIGADFLVSALIPRGASSPSRADHITSASSRGGYLQKIRPSLKYLCPSEHIPPKVEVDLAKLDIDDRVLLTDIEIHPSVKLLSKNETMPICKVVATKPEEATPIVVSKHTEEASEQP